MSEVSTNYFRTYMGEMLDEVAKGEDCLIYEQRKNRWFKLTFERQDPPPISPRRYNYKNKPQKPYESILPPELRGDREPGPHE